MSTTTISVSETVEDWPPAPSGLSAAAAAIPPAVIWSRIEGWISHRFSPRPVTFVVEGPGAWSPPLVPFTGTLAEVWDGSAWSTTLLKAAPLGYELDCGPYRITGTAGSDDDVPPAVAEAYRRLAEYFASDPNDAAGSTSERQALGPLEVSFEREPRWLARAMSYSGAADLLRPWRRA